MSWKRLFTLWMATAAGVSVVAFPVAVAGALTAQAFHFRKIKITPTGST